MAYTIEEAREAFAHNKITLDEYTLTIDRAVESMQKKPKERKQSAPLNKNQRNRREFARWWIMDTLIVESAALAISTGD